MAQENYLIEGISGVGKTTVCNELQRRGYNAIDGDEAFGYFADPETGLPTDEHTQLNWIWDENKIESILNDKKQKTGFVCGGATNQDRFENHFKKVFTLYVDDDTLRHRLLHRTNNDFGKKPDDLARQLEWNKSTVAYAKHRGAVPIDATKPITAVVDEMLRNIKHSA